MNRTSAAQLATARRLLEPEQQGQGAQERAAAAGRVCDKVCLHLGSLVGTAQLHALFGRSVKLAQAEHPCLDATAATSGPSAHAADAMRGCVNGREPAAMTEIAVTLLATFFALLACFLGDGLIEHALRGV